MNRDDAIDDLDAVEVAEYQPPLVGDPVDPHAELLEHLDEFELCSIQACTGSLGALGAEAQVDKGPRGGWVGWSAILQRTAGITDRFYL